MGAKSQKTKQRKHEKSSEAPTSKPQGVKVQTLNHEQDVGRYLYRQKGDFSKAELQDLQRKLERWIAEAPISRLFRRGSKEGARIEEEISQSEDDEEIHDT